MGFRFQRRMRLAPGVRLNTTRLRPGLSIGPPGISLVLGAGEGGEGLAVSLEILANGEIRYRHADGSRMTQDEARGVRRHAEDTLRQALQAHCERLNAALDGLGRLHEQTPPPDAVGYQPRSYTEAPPVPVSRRRPAWWHAFWPPARGRLEQENARRQASHAEAYRAWEWRKAEFDTREFARQQREDEAAWSDPDAMRQTLIERLEEIAWPRETPIDFDLGDDCRTIAVDIDLPGEEELPDRRWAMPAKRIKLSPRRLTVTEQRQLYRAYVHGLVFLVLGVIFARLPRTERALVSGYRADSAAAASGRHAVYLFSVKATREQWERLPFDRLEELDPVGALEGFPLRRELTRAGGFRDIQPFEMDWRWR